MKYRALTGVDYADPKSKPGASGRRPTKRYEAGDIVEGLAADHWFVTQGIVEPVEEGKRAKAADPEITEA